MPFRIIARKPRKRTFLIGPFPSKKGFPAGNYMFKVNTWRRSVIFIINFEHISHLVLVFLLLTLSRYMPAGGGG